MIGIVFMTIFLLAGLYSFMNLSDTKDIIDNWPKHRCKVNIMPFASFYGHNTAENFDYCMKNIFTGEAGPMLSPIFMILGTMLSTISILITTINSIRVQFATFMGGVNLMFQNFADRFIQLTYRIQMTAARIKSLMNRVFGIFFAIIYMSMSGLTSLTNFSETFLFSFLDTFCFDPSTLIDVKEKGLIPIRDVKLGDTLTATGARVTSVFSFAADGQPMVKLGKILVSTNHFVQDSEKWVRAEEHSRAVPAAPWMGGTERPLICLNTSDHKIPLDDFVFLDYDETEDADAETMNWVETRVNGRESKETRPEVSYSNVLDPSTLIKMKNGTWKPLRDVQLYDEVSTGRVIGLVEKEVTEISRLPTQQTVGSGLLIWKDEKWVRAGSPYPKELLENPIPHKNIILTPSAVVETNTDLVFRDYMEIHSPDAEHAYERTIRSY